MDSLKETITYLTDLIEKILEETLDQSDFSDLTHQQLHYLKVLVKMDNPTLSELAKELDLTKPTVTVLVDKLEEKGYIRRFHSDEDRRVVYLHMDKKGEKLIALRKIAHERMAEKIRSDLNVTETAILNNLLKKIVNPPTPNQE
jgi:MarR family transcriptional regulator, transcriptional regulator for hemolysin